MNNSVNIYYWGVCPVCKGIESLRLCGRCKLLYYCSREHQKIHWPFHKSVCTIISQLSDARKSVRLFQNAYKCCGLKEWNDIRTRAALFTELALGRKLVPFERQMFMFPKVCEVCKSDDQKILTCCDKCFCVNYCSSTHRYEDIHHIDKCSLLKLCKALDLTINDTNYLPFLNIVASVHFKQFSLPQNMEEFLTKFFSTKENHNLQKEKVLCSELLSCPLTLLYVLKLIEFFSTTNGYLTVHIVGASELECGFPNVWQVVLHCLPQIVGLHLVFVGPDTVVPKQNFLTCSSCAENEKHLKLEFHSILYHDYVKSVKDMCPPDVIAAFNCGFQENDGCLHDTWKVTLPFFFKFTNAHIMFTSYTEIEAARDLDILMRSNHSTSKVLFQNIINPYSSNRPHRDWDQLRMLEFCARKVCDEWASLGCAESQRRPQQSAPEARRQAEPPEGSRAPSLPRAPPLLQALGGKHEI